MRYFHIRESASTLLQTPVDAEGRWPSRDFPSDGNSSVSFVSKKIRGRWSAEDALRCIGGDLVVSERLNSLIRELRVPDFLRHYRCSISLRVEKVADDYWVVHHFAQRFDPIDYVRSEVVRAAGVLVDTKVFRVDSDRTPPFDLFPSVPHGWVASERFRDAFARRALRGLEFLDA